MTPETPPPAPRRCRGWILGLLVLVLAGAAGLYFLFRPQPQKTAVVIFHVALQEPSILPREPSKPEEFESFCRSQVALIQSQRVLNSALNSARDNRTNLLPEIDNRLEWLVENLTVTSRGSGFIRVELKCDKEEEALAILNALARVYFEESQRTEQHAKQSRLEHLKKAQENLRQDIRVLSSAMDEVAMELGSPSAMMIEVLRRHLGEELLATQDSLSRERYELVEVKARLMTRRERQSVLLAVVGGLAHMDAPPEDVAQDIEDTHAVERLEFKMEYQERALDSLKASMREFAIRNSRMEELRRSIKVKETLADQIGSEIERAQVEINASPRVTLFEDAFVMVAKDDRDHSSTER